MFDAVSNVAFPLEKVEYVQGNKVVIREGVATCVLFFVSSFLVFRRALQLEF